LKAEAELLGKEKQGFSDMKKLIVNGGQLTVYPVENVLRNFD
jgi:hypothetical protein